MSPVSSVVLMTGVDSSLTVIRGGGAGAGGVCCSPAGVLTVNNDRRIAANTKFLTDFIDLLLKNVVVKASEAGV